LAKLKRLRLYPVADGRKIILYPARYIELIEQAALA